MSDSPSAPTPDPADWRPEPDLEAFLDRPRLAGLVLSPDGARLVTTVATRSPDRTAFTTALWEIDPTGSQPARRLTSSPEGERSPAFLSDGSLLFVSDRPAAGEKDGSGDGPDGKPAAGLWLLPAAGGEARLLRRFPGGVDALVTARSAPTMVVGTQVHPGLAFGEPDAAAHKQRTQAKVSAHLYDALPIRFWDSYLGPRKRRLITFAMVDGIFGEPVELTPEPGTHLLEAAVTISADGSQVLAGWSDMSGIPFDYQVRSWPAAGGEPEVLRTGSGWGGALACAPDGSAVAHLADRPHTFDTATRTWCELLRPDGSEPEELAPELDRWPMSVAWLPDSSGVVITADNDGERPLYLLRPGQPAQQVTDAGAHTDVCVSPDGSTAYALRSSPLEAPRPVAIDLTGAGPVRELDCPGGATRLPAVLERVTASAPDGADVRSWLVLPEGATGPVPLAVFIHGGPLGAWVGWTWRWNPGVFAARGYAVLLTDFALSTGHGQEWVQRGHGQWGGTPYTDLMAAVDGAVTDPRIDPARTLAMGGSYGGYMANWVAGHTDRFRGIVTHASLWELEGFRATSDVGWFDELEFGDPYVDTTRYRENSPNQHILAITTPTLVIHGLLDERVPISEGLRLFTELQRRGVQSRFLFFPDEGHWISKPNNVAVWYSTVLSFLAERLQGEVFQTHPLLR